MTVPHWPLDAVLIEDSGPVLTIASSGFFGGIDPMPVATSCIFAVCADIVDFSYIFGSPVTTEEFCGGFIAVAIVCLFFGEFGWSGRGVLRRWYGHFDFILDPWR